MGIIDEYIGQIQLTDEEKAESKKIVDSYDSLDMNVFINRIGGYEKIDEMKRINEAADRIKTVDGNIVSRNNKQRSGKEDIEEWKRGFMEGFEEAYKRLRPEL